MNPPSILWNDFVPGAELGEVTLPYSHEMIQAWQSIYGKRGAGDAALAAGVALAMMMRAYLTVVAPRPPGNVHARQAFSLLALPKPDEAVRTVLRCLSKEIRRERRYVQLQAQGTGAHARTLYAGVLSLVWAA